jgi:hypothetical protein
MFHSMTTRDRTAEQGHPRTRGQRRAGGVAARIAVAAAGLAWVGATVPAAAQKKPKGSVAGRVASVVDGEPVAAALVRLVAGADTFVVRGGDDGRFVVPAVPPGTHLLTAKRIGFDSATITVTVGETRVRADLELAPRVGAAVPVQVTGAFTGITGTVGDFLRMEPLASATVRVLGGGGPLASDSAGRFAVELEPRRSYAIRVDKPGFAPQLVSVTVDSGRRADFLVLLDPVDRPARDNWKWEEFDQRQRVNRYRATGVSRTELAAQGAQNLLIALQYAPSVVERGLQVTPRACLFLDGIARPNLRVDGVPTEPVEFVEVVAHGADVSRTLATRWPSGTGTTCGVTDARRRRTIGIGPTPNPMEAQYILIWTRSP